MGGEAAGGPASVAFMAIGVRFPSPVGADELELRVSGLSGEVEKVLSVLRGVGEAVADAEEGEGVARIPVSGDDADDGSRGGDDLVFLIEDLEEEGVIADIGGGGSPGPAFGLLGASGGIDIEDPVGGIDDE